MGSNFDLEANVEGPHAASPAVLLPPWLPSGGVICKDITLHCIYRE